MLARRLSLFFYLSLLSYIVSSVSISGVLLSDHNGTNVEKAFAYFTAILFWLGIICGTTLLFKANKCRKIMMRRSRYKENIRLPRNFRCGAVSFLNNKEAAIADVFLFGFTLVVFIISLFKVKSEEIIIVSVMLWFMSFILHCFLNGKNYKYIKLYKKCFIKGAYNK